MNSACANLTDFILSAGNSKENFTYMRRIFRMKGVDIFSHHDILIIESYSIREKALRKHGHSTKFLRKG